MGVFSWCTSDTKKSIPCCKPFGGLPGTVYLLNPFGEPYKESDYEGYGEFGGRDAYELVAEWNREYLTADNIEKPERGSFTDDERGNSGFSRSMEKYRKTCAAISAYASGATDDYMLENYGKILGYGGGSDWKRCLGIQIAHYNEQHVKLKYPIKIVEVPMEYELAGISPLCPFQGCMYPDNIIAIHRKVQKAFDELASCEMAYKAIKMEVPSPMPLQIVDRDDVDISNTIYTVVLEPGLLVDVKLCTNTGLIYVMQNEDGSAVYSNGKERDTVPDYKLDEEAVINFVKTEHLRIEKERGNMKERYRITPETECSRYENMPLEALIREKEELQGAISNEKTFQKGCSTFDDIWMHEYTISALLQELEYVEEKISTMVGEQETGEKGLPNSTLEKRIQDASRRVAESRIESHTHKSEHEI